MIRLNVGSVEVLTFFDELIHCVVDSQSMPTQVKTDSRVGVVLTPGGVYQTVPNSAVCNFPSAQAVELLPLLRGAHQSLIRASARLLNPAARRSHSPGVVEFLANETGEPLSNPSYWSAFEQASVDSYLLKSNTKKFLWERLPQAVAGVRKNSFFNARWSCGVTKRIKRGDRFFLMRTGEAPRGIMGSGIITKEPHYLEHFDPDRQDDDALYVGVRFDALLDPQDENILPIDEIQSPNLAGFHWHTQGSGIHIPAAGAADLEIQWAAFLDAKGLQPFNTGDEVLDPARFAEGAVRQVNVNVYERNPLARQASIQHFGCRCVVCNFDFEEVFGELGCGFIHVHHLKALSEIGEEYEVDPIADLRPVCPNCHAMIHRNEPMISIEELKARVRKPAFKSENVGQV